MLRAGVWVRVTSDRRETSRQAARLQAEARARGWTVAALFRTDPVQWRSGFDAAVARLLADAREGRVEALVVWTLDHLGAEGRPDGVARALDLIRLGVTVVSLEGSAPGDVLAPDGGVGSAPSPFAGAAPTAGTASPASP